MGQLVIILGALTALNLGFSVLVKDDSEKAVEQNGEVAVEQVEVTEPQAPETLPTAE